MNHVFAPLVSVRNRSQFGPGERTFRSGLFYFDLAGIILARAHYATIRTAVRLLTIVIVAFLPHKSEVHRRLISVLDLVAHPQKMH